MVIKKTVVPLPRIPSRKGSRLSGLNSDRSEDVLQSLRRVSQSLGVMRVKELYVKQNVQKSKCRLFFLTSVALATIAWGIGSLIFTPLQILLKIRLEMTPGLPPYDWWVTPPDEVLLRVYVFNVTNSEAFLNGTDKKLQVQEIGPIIYKEWLVHSHVQHNENSTLSFRANRTAIFLPEMNTINLNDTIIVPNVATLLLPAYFHDYSMIFKMGVNMLLRSYNAQPLVKTTIHNYLWNKTDPILDPAANLAPHLVPTKNVGLLNIIYSGLESDVSVFIGNQHGHSKFFTIDTYEGSEFLPHFSEPKCQQRFRNASEGLGYPQMITRNVNLTYWRKTLCKLADIRYARDQSKYSMNGYRFEFVPWAYDRIEWEGNPDCYTGEPTLPNGLIDVSPCYWNFPIAASFPHFLHSDDIVKNYVNGLNPNDEDHGSYVLIEPITGIPMEGKARSQINLIMHKLRGFPQNMQRFSDMAIPLAWLEYHQVGVPWYIQWLMYYVAVIIPIIQLPLSLISLSVGVMCIYFTILYLTHRQKDGSEESLIKNQGLKFETESFLKDVDIER